MSQLNRNANHCQESIEEKLYKIGILTALIEHDRLRVSQAIRRKGELTDLLEPVMEDFDRIMNTMRSIQEHFREQFENGQADHWT